MRPIREVTFENGKSHYDRDDKWTNAKMSEPASHEYVKFSYDTICVSLKSLEKNLNERYKCINENFSTLERDLQGMKNQQSGSIQSAGKIDKTRNPDYATLQSALQLLKNQQAKLEQEVVKASKTKTWVKIAIPLAAVCSTGTVVGVILATSPRSSPHT